MKLAVPAILRVRSLSFRLYVLILLALVLMLLVQLVIAHLEISGKGIFTDSAAKPAVMPCRESRARSW